MQELSGDYSKAKAENGTTKKSRKKQDCRTEISIPLSDGLTDRDLNAAIGWLAREDKVYFETDKNNTEFLYLSVDVYY